MEIKKVLKEIKEIIKKNIRFILLFLSIIFLILVARFENALLWIIFTISSILTINFFYKHKRNRKFIDKTIAVTIVLTVVLIYIGKPIFLERIEVSAGNPSSLTVSNEGNLSYRFFDFQITPPIIGNILPFFHFYKEVKIGNRVYNSWGMINNSGLLSSGIYWDKSLPNSIKFYNPPPFSDRGFDKEIIQLKIQTDYPIDYFIFPNNVTYFEVNNSYPDKLFFCSNGAFSIYNDERDLPILFDTNLTVLIPQNTPIFGKTLNYFIESYPKGCFNLVNSCDREEIILANPYVTKQDNNYKFVFPIYEEINASSNNYYIIRYFPYFNCSFEYPNN